MEKLPEQSVYYESLQEVEAAAAEDKKKFLRGTREFRSFKTLVTVLLTVSIVGLVFSVLPAIPALIIRSFHNPWPVSWLHERGYRVAEWPVIWPSCVVAFGIAVTLFAIIGSGLSNAIQARAPKTHRLSYLQKRFVECYEAYRELEKYTLNGLEGHLARSEAALSRVIRNELGWPRSLGHDMPPWESTSFTGTEPTNLPDGAVVRTTDSDGRVFYLGSRVRWGVPTLEEILTAQEHWAEFQPWVRITIADETLRVKAALDKFGDAVLPRIAAGDQIAAITPIVRTLAEYYYYRIPELRMSLPPEQKDQMDAMATISLGEFVTQVSALPPAEDVATIVPSSPARELAGQKRILFSLVGNRNPLIRFTSWLVIGVLATSGLAAAAHQITGLKVDSLWVITVISTSVLAAATLTAFHPQGRTSKEPIGSRRRARRGATIDTELDEDAKADVESKLVPSEQLAPDGGTESNQPSVIEVPQPFDGEE